MRIAITNQPPISIFFTNIALIAVVIIKLLISSGDSAESIVGEYSGDFITVANLIYSFQSNYTGLSITLTAIVLLITSSLISRISTRNMLYGVRSLTASPISVVAIASLLTPSNSLYISLIALCTSYSIHLNFTKIAISTNFRNILYGGIFTALVVVLYPPITPIIVIMPFTIALLRRTFREEIVAIIAILFTLFTYIYIYWLCGYDITTPLVEIYNNSLEIYSSGFKMISNSELIHYIPIAIIFTLSIFALPSLNDFKYQVETQSRMIFITIMGFASIALIMCGGNFAPLMAVAVIAISILSNRLLVSANGAISLIIYTLLLLVSVITQLFF